MADVVKSEELERYDFGDYSSADALLAYELNQLSVQERDQLNEEIHGVLDQSQHETPELIKNSLEQMNVELSNLPDSPSKKAYETALQHPESYVHTDDFRLIFLRCEFFNTRKAAERYMHYLDLINYAFGEKVLQRDIRLSDFDEESMKFVRMGYQQILPGMDRTGRRIGGNFAFKVNHSVPLKARVCTVRTINKTSLQWAKRRNNNRYSTFILSPHLVFMPSFSISFLLSFSIFRHMHTYMHCPIRSDRRSTSVFS